MTQERLGCRIQDPNLPPQEQLSILLRCILSFCQYPALNERFHNRISRKHNMSSLASQFCHSLLLRLFLFLPCPFSVTSILFGSIASHHFLHHRTEQPLQHLSEFISLNQSPE